MELLQFSVKEYLNLKTGHFNPFNSDYFWVIFNTNAITMNNFRVNNILKLQRTKGTKIASMILAP
jgi:hypothetical protein